MEFNPGPEIIYGYFEYLTASQKEQFHALGELYAGWNSKINVISRKDLASLYQNHVLHSLGIAKVQQFEQGDTVLDVGTGGGFPGIPLAILFPNVHFHLVDSIHKKIHVVEQVIKELQLTNASCEQTRMEQLSQRYHFVICRAVARLDRLVQWTRPLIRPDGQLICLKGGDLQQEIAEVSSQVEVYPLIEFFREPFFQTKQALRVFTGLQ